MSTVREKTTFRRGRSHRGQRNYYQSRRGRGRGRGGPRRNQQRNYSYRKRPKENTNILTKQDFFNVGLLVLERKFEKNNLEEIVRENPGVFVTQKRGIIVDTRREFRLKKAGAKKPVATNSKKKIIGSVLDNLRQEEEIPQWYQEDEDDEEFGEEMLMGGIDRGNKEENLTGNLEGVFQQWKIEEQEENEKTMVMMESLLHMSSDEEDNEWGEKNRKMEESGLNLMLDKEFTLESLAGQTKEVEKEMNRFKSQEDLEQPEETPEENEEEIVNLKSLSLLGKFIDEKETYFDDLDKQIEQSFMISKQEESKQEETKKTEEEVGKVLEDNWKPEFKNDFDFPMEGEFFEDVHNDSSLNMEDMLQQVDNEYEDVFAGFESNINKILYGGSFMDDSILTQNNEEPSFGGKDDVIFTPEIGENLLEPLKGEDEESEEKEEAKELTPEEKQKRKEHFMKRYQIMLIMLDQMARDALTWQKKNKKKVKAENQPVNKMTEESVGKFTAQRYKVFSMLLQGCIFYKTWYYKDSEGEKHGPFMGFDMDIWNAEEKLKTDFLISPDDKTYLCYDKFNERDSSIMDLMHDVIKEQERVLKMNALKIKEEQLKKQKSKRGRGRGRSRGGKQRERGYRKRDWGRDKGYDRNYYQERRYQKDHGEFYFKKKKKGGYRDREFIKQEQKFEPKNLNLFKKKKNVVNVNEEDFPTLGFDQKKNNENKEKKVENVLNQTNQNKNFTKKKNSESEIDVKEKFFKKKNPTKPSPNITKIGFNNPDEIPEISKKVEEEKSENIPKTSKKKVISGWDIEVKVVKKQGKKKRKKKRGKKNKSKKKEDKKNEKLTNNKKKM